MYEENLRIMSSSFSICLREGTERFVESCFRSNRLLNKFMLHLERHFDFLDNLLTFYNLEVHDFKIYFEMQHILVLFQSTYLDVM